MSVQVEKLEKNMAKLTIEVSSEEFENAIAKYTHTRKIKIKSLCQASVKEKLLVL